MPVQEAMDTPTTGMQGQDTPGMQRGMSQSDIREQVQEQARQAEMRIRDEIDKRTSSFGDQLTSVASAMRTGTEDLRNEGKDDAAMLMDRGAEQVDRFGRYLAQANGDQMLRDVEDFGRRRPGMFAFGGLVLGFAAARFLRASADRRMQGNGSMTPVYPTEVAYGDTGTYETSPTTMPTEVGGT